MESSILTFLIFLPVAGAIIMLPFASLYGKEANSYYKWIAAITTGIQLILCIILYQNFDPSLSVNESPFTVQLDWIKHFNIQYYIGIDGLSIPMVLLTGLLSFICIKPTPNSSVELWSANINLESSEKLFVPLLGFT